MAENVCSSCIGDADLRQWIREQGGPRGCDFCGRFDSPTADLDEFASHVLECLRQWWSFAVDELPYDSSEGGYQGSELWDTDDVVDMAEIDFPRDQNDRLRRSLIHALPDETWCEYDWLTLDVDQALGSSWDQFCETIKHRRRFFFHSTGHDDRDSYTPASLLSAIAGMSSRLGLISQIAVGTRLWRARPDLARGARVSAGDFGPPPVQRATQSNRMNPPGIPMLYLASSTTTAVLETRSTESRVGRWRVIRPLRVLDLRRLPGVPGYFGDGHRSDRLALKFLRSFAADIMAPVARDDHAHIEYLPSQVVTEFMRDHDFEGGRIDGIAYGSTVHRSGWNVALFASPGHLGLELDLPRWLDPAELWLEFAGSKFVSIRPEPSPTPAPSQR